MERWKTTTGDAAHPLAVGRERGSSLIEILVTIALSAMLATMAVAFARTVLLGIRRHDTSSGTQQAAAMALDLLTRDIEMAGCAATLTSRPGIRLALPSSIEVATDLNADADTDDANERATYSLNIDKGTITRASGNGNPQPLLRNVLSNGLRLQYYSAGGERIAAPAEEESLRAIVSVRIQMRIGNSDGSDSVQLSRVATLRNR